MTHPSPLLTRRWTPPRSMLLKNTTRTTWCSSGSPPSCFLQWRPSRFTVEGMSYSCGEQFLRCGKSRLFRDHQTSQHIVHAFDPRLHKQYGREVRNFDIAVWEREREDIVLVGTPSSPKIQSYNHISWTQATGFSQKLALTDLVWGIRYTSHDVLYVSRRYVAT